MAVFLFLVLGGSALLYYMLRSARKAQHVPTTPEAFVSYKEILEFADWSALGFMYGRHGTSEQNHPQVITLHFEDDKSLAVTVFHPHITSGKSKKTEEYAYRIGGTIPITSTTRFEVKPRVFQKVRFEWVAGSGNGNNGQMKSIPNPETGAAIIAHLPTGHIVDIATYPWVNSDQHAANVLANLREKITEFSNQIQAAGFPSPLAATANAPSAIHNDGFDL